MKKFNFILTGALTATLIFPGMAIGHTAKVKQGDTLYKIAIENKMTVKQLKSINGIKSNLIYPGQYLKTIESKYSKIGKIINASYLNIRTGPGISYKSMGELKKGTVVVMHYQKNGWVKVTAGSINGYVSGKYISNSNKINDSTMKEKIVNTKKIFYKPTSGVVTSKFGPRWNSFHKGLDIAKSGKVQVKSAQAGTISRSYTHSSYGEVVFIKHIINGKKYETVYAHMKKGTRTVKVGDVVAKGQFLGWMGSTGDSTGQHLHFEVHIGDWLPGRPNAVDPSLYLK